MYVIDCVFERSRNARLIRLVQEAPDEEQALAVLRAGIDSQLDEVTTEAGRTGLYRDVHTKFKNAAPPYYGVTRHDVYGAIVVFVLVTATTLPAIVPFLLTDDLKLALRVSNLLMILMLFAVGFRWAGRTNTNRWTAGLFVMLGGVVMVGVAEALGG
jgi:VIT1/CCC1 family predicted Fe2+/Mn2+ transporter